MDETLSASDLAGRLDVDRSTISRWRSSGRLPSPIASPKSSGARWSVEAIDEWLAEMDRVADQAESLRRESANPQLPEATRLYVRAVQSMLADLRIPLETRVQLAEGYRQTVGTMPDDNLSTADSAAMLAATALVQKSHQAMTQRDGRTRKGSA